MDPAKTLFLEQREVLIFVENSYYHMLLIPKDRFGNAATLSQEMLTAEVRKVLSSVTGRLFIRSRVIHMASSYCKLKHVGSLYVYRTQWKGS